MSLKQKCFDLTIFKNSRCSLLLVRSSLKINKKLYLMYVSQIKVKIDMGHGLRALTDDLRLGTIAIHYTDFQRQDVQDTVIW